MHSLLLLMGRTEPVSARDLARFQELPERFLAKLFTRLKKAGLIVGKEGVQGGYVLARPPVRYQSGQNSIIGNTALLNPRIALSCRH